MKFLWLFTMLPFWGPQCHRRPPKFTHCHCQPFLAPTSLSASGPASAALPLLPPASCRSFPGALFPSSLKKSSHELSCSWSPFFPALFRVHRRGPDRVGEVDDRRPVVVAPSTTGVALVSILPPSVFPSILYFMNVSCSLLKPAAPQRQPPATLADEASCQVIADAHCRSPSVIN